MAQTDGRQTLIFTILCMEILYLVLVIADPGTVAALISLCSRGGNHQKATQIVLPLETDISN